MCKRNKVMFLFELFVEWGIQNENPRLISCVCSYKRWPGDGACECWKKLGQWDQGIVVCAEPTSCVYMIRFSFLNKYLVNLARKVHSRCSKIEMHKKSISEPSYQIRQRCFSRANYCAFSNMIERELSVHCAFPFIQMSFMQRDLDCRKSVAFSVLNNKCEARVADSRRDRDTSTRILYFQTENFNVWLKWP